jgi:hypothetical protein
VPSAPQYWRPDLFAFNASLENCKRECRAASPRRCGQIPWQRAVGLPVLALPFQPAKHIAPPSGEPCWHRPGRSSGRLWRNKAAPWREDALGPTWDFHSFSGPESTQCSSPNTRLPWPDMEQPSRLCTVPHIFGVNAAGSGIYVWMGRRAASVPARFEPVTAASRPEGWWP